MMKLVWNKKLGKAVKESSYTNTEHKKDDTSNRKAAVKKTRKQELSMNSYADTTYADEYLSQMYGEQWTGIDMGKKQYALNHASLMIDLIPSIEGIKYKGHKTNPYQEAEFPRNITGDEVPERVKQAVCQEAMYIVSAEEDITLTVFPQG